MILVTGANGAVGSYLKEVFSDNELYLTDIDTMDVTDYTQIKKTVTRVKPEIILHLAAETDVDRCEKEPDHAYKTNTIGTQNVAFICKEYNILLVYISTAGVFGGDNRFGPFTEFDTPCPVSVYGNSKLQGEKVVQQLLDKYFIVRAGWMFGGGKEKDKKFVAKILNLCETHNEINIVNDKYGSPTYAKDLLIGIKSLLETKFYGIYHMANTGCASRYDVAVEIVKLLKKNIKLNPVSSAYFPLPAPRPFSESIRNYKLELMGFKNIRLWQEAIKEYIQEWQKK